MTEAESDLPLAGGSPESPDAAEGGAKRPRNRRRGGRRRRGAAEAPETAGELITEGAEQASAEPSAPAASESTPSPAAEAREERRPAQDRAREEEPVPERFSADPDDDGPVPERFSAEPDEPARETEATARDEGRDRPEGDRTEEPGPAAEGNPRQGGPGQQGRFQGGDRRDGRPQHQQGGGRPPFDPRRGQGDRGGFQGGRDRGFNPQKGGGKPFQPQQGGGQQGGGRPFPQQGGGGQPPRQQGPNPGQQGGKKGKFRAGGAYAEPDAAWPLELGNLPDDPSVQDLEALAAQAKALVDGGVEPLELNRVLPLPLPVLVHEARQYGCTFPGNPNRVQALTEMLRVAGSRGAPIYVQGILETTDEGFGLIVYPHENYKVRPLSAFLPAGFIRRYALQRGHEIRALIAPPRPAAEGSEVPAETCPRVLRIETVMGGDPEAIAGLTPFEDLVPYYPTRRILLERTADVKWDNLSMRVVDLLTPVGFGQRGLIVAPPRTGKTIVQQGIANAIQVAYPEAHLIILLIDERPEEVTDFRRQVNGEVISSTFDESPENHVHCAEVVIERARRLVEVGRHVVILLDSITRLARAYNALMPSSGKILSGGVEATALQKPKRFFGSARNIEGGGSLTILGTALVETGSRMDEVIFEEFKGTGNMELHLDRALVDKRIFPAINLEKSGTRKEELLYHPDELLKIYSLRRAMKGVPSTEAMEMLITRVKKTRSNAEFLLGISR